MALLIPPRDEERRIAMASGQSRVVFEFCEAVQLIPRLHTAILHDTYK